MPQRWGFLVAVMVVTKKEFRLGKGFRLQGGSQDVYWVRVSGYKMDGSKFRGSVGLGVPRGARSG